MLSGEVIEAGVNNNGGNSIASGHLTIADIDNTNSTFSPILTAVRSSGGHGSYTINANGDWTYTLNQKDNAVQHLNEGDSLNDSFTVVTNDGTTQIINVLIDGANDAAVIKGTSTGILVEAGIFNNQVVGIATATGTLTNTDVDNTANTFQEGSGLTTYGSYSIDDVGHWSYSLNNGNGNIQALNSGQSVNDTFTVYSEDGTAKNIIVTIQGSNDAASITGTASGSVTEAGQLQ